MTDYEIFSEMYALAVSLLNKRYPDGWGCAAIIRSADGRYFTSVYMDAISRSVELCFETGAILDAHKEDVLCTHSLSIVREDTGSPVKIILPCGVCQERMRFWGEDFKVASESNGDQGFITLKQLSPHHWTDIFPKNEIEDYFYYHK